ncbi:MAG: hypothetical protein LVS60_12565 [Nodosilinea sp. LVE1205-7]
MTDPQALAALEHQVTSLPEIHRPILLLGSLADPPAAIAGLTFDRLVGYNVLGSLPEPLTFAPNLRSWLGEGGGAADGNHPPPKPADL